MLPEYTTIEELLESKDMIIQHVNDTLNKILDLPYKDISTIEIWIISDKEYNEYSDNEIVPYNIYISLIDHLYDKYTINALGYIDIFQCECQYLEFILSIIESHPMFKEKVYKVSDNYDCSYRCTHNKPITVHINV